MLTYETVRQLLYYSPTTGKFWWRPRPREMFETEHRCKIWNTRYAGKEAGCHNRDGYVLIAIFNKLYYAHRLAWLHFFGEWPPEEIDHRECDCRDTRIFRLRESSRSENGCNRGLQTNNTSGYKGVYKSKGKYAAQIKKHGKVHYLGLYRTAEEAYAVRRAASLKLHGDFSKL